MKLIRWKLEVQDVKSRALLDYCVCVDITGERPPRRIISTMFEERAGGEDATRCNSRCVAEEREVSLEEKGR